MFKRSFGTRVLWSRATEYVRRYAPLIIGVTGSFGKTLTKEAIALALLGDRTVRASHESYNTPVGVALSVLGVRAQQSAMGWIRLLISSRGKELATDPEPDTIVLELGADRPGDIDWLVQQLPFQIGVVTGVGSAHLEYFTSKEMVAHEKMSLVVSLPPDGTAILNADDPLVLNMREHTKAKVLLFGEHSQADVRIIRAQRTGMRGFVGEVSIVGTSYEFSFPNIVGRHQIHSALAALAVAYVLGVDIPRAIKGLSHLVPPTGRMRMLDGVHNTMIIDDTYNASPESTRAALRTLETLDVSGRKIAVLGDMLELGSKSHAFHKEIGHHVARAADVSMFVGEHMKYAQAVVLKESGDDTHHFESSRDVGKWLSGHLKSGDVVLVKGSRAMHMERVVEQLVRQGG